MVVVRRAPFHKRTTRFGFLCHEVMHLLGVLSVQLFRSICNGTCANFAHPLWPHPNPIKTLLAYFGCLRGFMCSFDLPPNLTQWLKLKWRMISLHLILLSMWVVLHKPYTLNSNCPHHFQVFHNKITQKTPTSISLWNEIKIEVFLL
jgi:hypothetical protein